MCRISSAKNLLDAPDNVFACCKFVALLLFFSLLLLLLLLLLLSCSLFLFIVYSRSICLCCGDNDGLLDRSIPAGEEELFPAAFAVPKICAKDGACFIPPPPPPLPLALLLLLLFP